MTLDRGDNVNLTCNTAAGPNTTFYWLKLGQDKACCQGGQSANITGKKPSITYHHLMALPFRVNK